MGSCVRNWLNTNHTTCSYVVSVKEKIKQRREIGRKEPLERVESDKLYENEWLREGFRRCTPRKAVAGTKALSYKCAGCDAGRGRCQQEDEKDAAFEV